MKKSKKKNNFVKNTIVVSILVNVISYNIHMHYSLYMFYGYNSVLS